MNLKEFCKQQHISKPTIYKRIHDAGIELSSLRDPDGNLTAEAITTLAALLDDAQPRYSKRVSDDPEAAAIDTAADPVKYAQIITERDEARRERDEARAQLAAAKDQIMQLQAEALERERAHAEAWKQFTERQQEIEAHRLLAAHAGADGRSVWQRIRAVFKPDKGDQT
jgi:predicted  nucleic acid-binding Zn-ribbon protein